VFLPRLGDAAMPQVRSFAADAFGQAPLGFAASSPHGPSGILAQGGCLASSPGCCTSSRSRPATPASRAVSRRAVRAADRTAVRGKHVRPFGK